MANRVGEIHQSSHPEQWRHVPGVLNPADLATRGMKAVELAESKFWLEGPEFLKQDEIGHQGSLLKQSRKILVALS